MLCNQRARSACRPEIHDVNSTGFQPGRGGCVRRAKAALGRFLTRNWRAFFRHQAVKYAWTFESGAPTPWKSRARRGSASMPPPLQSVLDLRDQEAAE